jgi:hypothetical protein
MKMMPKKLKSYSVNRRLVGTAVGADTEDSPIQLAPISNDL